MESLELDGVNNFWQAVAFLGSVLIVVGGPWLMQRAKRAADKTAATESETVRRVEERVERVPELLGTVRLLSDTVEQQAATIDEISARVASFEDQFRRYTAYHDWLNSLGLPRPPYLEYDEWKKRYVIGP